MCYISPTFINFYLFLFILLQDIDKQLPLAEACFNFVSTILPAAFHAAIKNDDLDK